MNELNSEIMKISLLAPDAPAQLAVSSGACGGADLALDLLRAEANFQ